MYFTLSDLKAELQVCLKSTKLLQRKSKLRSSGNFVNQPSSMRLRQATTLWIIIMIMTIIMMTKLTKKGDWVSGRALYADTPKQTYVIHIDITIDTCLAIEELWLMTC